MFFMNFNFILCKQTIKYENKQNKEKNSEYMNIKKNWKGSNKKT